MSNYSKKMLVFGGLAVLFAAVASAEPIVDSSKAAFHVGSEVMVCGQVSGLKDFSKGTYINVGGQYPNQHITFLVWEKDRPNFNARFGSLSVFVGAQACARGLVESYKNKLQIKVVNPQFLRLMK